MNPAFARPITTAKAESAAEAAYDATLVTRFNAGDESAFVEIMRRYHNRLFSLAHNLLRNAADAEEIVQDAFIRAHRGLANFRGDSSLATWLYRIALNLSRNRYWYFFRRRRQDSLSLDHSLKDIRVIVRFARDMAVRIRRSGAFTLAMGAHSASVRIRRGKGFIPPPPPARLH